jgi:solute:Na+ symporter, SSS family
MGAGRAAVRHLDHLVSVIAVPALVYAVGAYGFFALPYTIIVYPFVFAVPSL